MIAGALLWSSWHSAPDQQVCCCSPLLVVSVNLCVSHNILVIVLFLWRRRKRRCLEDEELSSVAHINGLQDVAGFGIAQSLDAKLLLRLDGCERRGDVLDRNRILLGGDRPALVQFI